MDSSSWNKRTEVEEMILYMGAGFIAHDDINFNTVEVNGKNAAYKKVNGGTFVNADVETGGFVSVKFYMGPSLVYETEALNITPDSVWDLEPSLKTTLDALRRRSTEIFEKVKAGEIDPEDAVYYSVGYIFSMIALAIKNQFNKSL